jgi:hypothetical protein
VRIDSSLSETPKGPNRTRQTPGQPLLRAVQLHDNSVSEGLKLGSFVPIGAPGRAPRQTLWRGGSRRSACETRPAPQHEMVGSSEVASAVVTRLEQPVENGTVGPDHADVCLWERSTERDRQGPPLRTQRVTYDAAGHRPASFSPHFFSLSSDLRLSSSPYLAVVDAAVAAFPFGLRDCTVGAVTRRPSELPGTANSVKRPRAT